ncbi:hypothetical protein YC2023_109399 [Brassica napus]
MSEWSLRFEVAANESLQLLRHVFFSQSTMEFSANLQQHHFPHRRFRLYLHPRHALQFISLVPQWLLCSKSVAVAVFQFISLVLFNSSPLTENHYF